MRGGWTEPPEVVGTRVEVMVRSKFLPLAQCWNFTSYPRPVGLILLESIYKLIWSSKEKSLIKWKSVGDEVDL